MNNLPTYMHIEIVTLVAPAGKVLWEAPTEVVWTTAYNRWLAKWTEGPFLLGELMGKRKEPEEERMQMWIEDVDDFGMMVLNMAEAGRRAIRQQWNGQQ